MCLCTFEFLNKFHTYNDISSSSTFFKFSEIIVKLLETKEKINLNKNWINIIFHIIQILLLILSVTYAINLGA